MLVGTHLGNVRDERIESDSRAPARGGPGPAAHDHLPWRDDCRTRPILYVKRQSSPMVALRLALPSISPLRIELLVLTVLGYPPQSCRSRDLAGSVAGTIGLESGPAGPAIADPGWLASVRGSVAIATNEPFSNWPNTFTDPRLCAAIVDRVTFGGHIIETGTSSHRLAHTRATRKANP